MEGAGGEEERRKEKRQGARGERMVMRKVVRSRAAFFHEDLWLSDQAGRIDGGIV